jgi:putative Mn2+ efflux pump MntP
MENKRIFAIIGLVVGIFWGLKILVGWWAYSEVSDYIDGSLKEIAFYALVIQTLIDAVLLYFSAKNLNQTK